MTIQDKKQHPAVRALMGYQQGDEDGVMVLVSRQAIHETADLIDEMAKALELTLPFIRYYRDTRSIALSALKKARGQ